MGLFDAIINIKNLVTGGSAKVHLKLGTAKFGEPFDISMRVLVADQDLKIDGAFLSIQGIEEIEVPYDKPVKQTDGDNGINKNKKEIVRSHHVTSNQKIKMADAMVLKANEEYEWNVVAELEPSNQPVYSGKYCTHQYRVKAYVDCYGNDPDSGWTTLDMS